MPHCPTATIPCVKSFFRAFSLDCFRKIGRNEKEARHAVQTKARSGALQGGRVVFLPLSSIRPNPAQPRAVFDAQGLQELAASIRQYGVLQPLTVRKKAGFELVAGERRLRAAGLAGLCEVPCLLVSVDDQDAGLLALVEKLTAAGP